MTSCDIIVMTYNQFLAVCSHSSSTLYVVVPPSHDHWVEDPVGLIGVAVGGVATYKSCRIHQIGPLLELPQREMYTW